MKLNRRLFPSRARGGLLAFLGFAPRERVRYRATVPAPLPSSQRPELSAHWTIEPGNRLPACHWDAALACRQEASLASTPR